MQLHGYVLYGQVAWINYTHFWSSEQLTGRLAYTEQLPDKLPMADLLAVARVPFFLKVMRPHGGRSPHTPIRATRILRPSPHWLAARGGTLNRPHATRRPMTISATHYAKFRNL
jgi:hypothetical protein